MNTSIQKSIGWRLALLNVLSNTTAVYGVGVLFAVFSLLQNGLGLYPWIQNGFQRAVKFSRWLPQYDNDVWLPSVKVAMFQTLRVWYAVTATVYESPRLYVFCALMAFATIFYSFYLIGTKYFEDKPVALAATALITTGHSYIVSNGATIGVWNSVYFADAVVMACVLGFSIHAMLGGRVLLASLGFSTSMQLHILNGFSAFLFIFTPYLILSVIRREYRASIILSGCPMVTALAALLSPVPAASIEGSTLTLTEWVHYCYFRDPDDVLLTYSMVRSALPIAALAAAYIALRKRGRPLCYTDVFILSYCTMCALAVSVEYLHSNGIVFGKLSEVFTAMQLRRGMWVFYVVACYGVLSSAYERLLLRATPSLVMLVLWITIGLYRSEVLIPTVVIVLSVLDLFLSGLRLRAFVTLLCAVLFVGIVPLVTGIGAASYNFDVLSSALVFTEPRFIMISLLVATPVAIVERYCTNLKATNVIAIAVSIVCIAFGANSYAALPGALRNVNTVINVLSVSTIDYKEMLRRYHEDIGADESSFEEVLQVASAFGAAGKVLLPPMDTQVDPTLYAGIPLFLFEFYDRAYSLYSYRFAREYDNRLRSVFNVGLADMYRNDFLGNLSDAYEKLSSGQMQRIINAHGISAIITRRPLEGVVPLFVNGSFFLYTYDDVMKATP